MTQDKFQQAFIEHAERGGALVYNTALGTVVDFGDGTATVVHPRTPMPPELAIRTIVGGVLADNQARLGLSDDVIAELHSRLSVAILDVLD